MLIFDKLKNLFNSLPTVRFNDIKSLVSRCKDFIKKTKIKLNDLSKTNFDLGIYHLKRSNLDDAILRFRLVRRFSSRYKDLDYLLGRCYLEKLKYNKARVLFENYTKENNSKFSEEARYCLSITNNELDNIKSVPISIIDHKLGQQFDSYMKESKASKNKDSKNIVYEKIKEALESNEKVFNYNMLDLSCRVGLVAYFLRKDQLLHFLLGVGINKNMVEYCKKLSIDSHKVYNTVIKEDVKAFLISKAQTDSKFDIILGTDLITYSTDLKLFFMELKAYMNKNGIMTFNFSTKHHNTDYVFDPKLENFIYDKDHVARTVESCGWQVIKHEEIKSKKVEYPQVIMVIRLKKS